MYEYNSLSTNFITKKSKHIYDIFLKNIYSTLNTIQIESLIIVHSATLFSLGLSNISDVDLTVNYCKPVINTLKIKCETDDTFDIFYDGINWVLKDDVRYLLYNKLFNININDFSFNDEFFFYYNGIKNTDIRLTFVDYYIRNRPNSTAKLIYLNNYIDKTVPIPNIPKYKITKYNYIVNDCFMFDSLYLINNINQIKKKYKSAKTFKFHNKNYITDITIKILQKYKKTK